MKIRKVLRSVLVAIPVIIASPVLVLAIQGGMFLPVGMFVAIYSPWTPFVLFPQTRWLVTHTIWMSRDLRALLFDVGWGLIVVGFLIFMASYVYFYAVRKRVGLVTTGPYAVVRHPQYLGIFLGLTGFSLLGARPIAVVALVTAVCTYLALMIHEEGENERRFGEQYRAYRDRVPFIIPYVPRALTRPFARLFALPRPAQYLGVAALYVVLLAAVISYLRDRSFPT
ncbi:MAG: isoprenylcysteine carboxylmethyltransferase family protein [Armatimonadota bacterium]|nr:isoprenylcysteine carboxylmethyltransferase family protein [Armatimonadota bacterium]